MTKIKICGITNIEDAIFAAELGVDALGFIFAKSPRRISPKVAAKIISKLPPFVTKVGVFVNHLEGDVNAIADYCGLDLLQLHGDEDLDYCSKLNRKVIKAFRMQNYNEIKKWQEQSSVAVDKASKAKVNSSDHSSVLRQSTIVAYLIDAYVSGKYGGTGAKLDWERVKGLKLDKPLVLAGGLNPQNVLQAIEIVKPYAVDVSSGVELKPGKKDANKLYEFVKAIQGKR